MKKIKLHEQSFRASEAVAIKTPEDVEAVVRQLDMQALSVECMVVVVLDGRHKVRKVAVIGQGTENACLVSPHLALRVVLETPRSVGFILAHNHPSGDTTPSADDLALTKRVAHAAQIMGYTFLDHVVVGEGGYCSIRESSGIEFNGA